MRCKVRDKRIKKIKGKPWFDDEYREKFEERRNAKIVCQSYNSVGNSRIISVLGQKQVGYLELRDANGKTTDSRSYRKDSTKTTLVKRIGVLSRSEKGSSRKCATKTSVIRRF